MTAEELVEAVARGIVADAENTKWEHLTRHEADTMRRVARAALRVVREAMGEPDEAMVAACRATTGAIITRKHCNEMWQGMLAASPIGRIDA